MFPSVLIWLQKSKSGQTNRNRESIWLCDGKKVRETVKEQPSIFDSKIKLNLNYGFRDLANSYLYHNYLQYRNITDKLY